MRNTILVGLLLCTGACERSTSPKAAEVTTAPANGGQITVTNSAGQSATFNIRRYNLLRLTEPQLAYTHFPKGNVTTDAQDSLGVPVVIVNGVKHYHPVFASWRGIQWLDNYTYFHDPIFLERAETIAVELTKRANRLRGGIYYPYTFNYAVLGLESETMVAPWYSGMAQGRLLSLMVRLYQVTNKPVYKAWADSIFTTFTNFKDAGSPWTVFVDKDGFYWIEEYPHPSGGNMVANGHSFGIYGLYDYMLLTGNATARTLVQGALTTTQQYAVSIRNPGSYSMYEIKHKIVSPTYHLVNIQNLNYFSVMTNDANIAAWRDLYIADHPVTGSFISW